MRKENLSSFIIISLSIAFIFISLMVFLTNGKSYWLKRKLKIGAIILTLSAATSGCKPPVTCYDPLPTDYMYVENIQNSEIQLNITKNNEVKGKILSPVI